MNLQVKVRRDAGTPLPKYQTHGSAGFDLSVAEDTKIGPQEMKLIPLGLSVATPPNHMLLLAARSSLFKRTKLIMANSVGIVDEDYCGDDDMLMTQLWNSGFETVKLERGERIVQGIFVPITRADFVETNSMVTASRGGFGSTGV